jgi:hypothetical protein
VTAAPSVAFYPSEGKYHITITGTGFPTTTAGIEVELAGTAQKNVLSASETQIVVELTSLTSGLAPNSMNLYLPSGTPKGITNLQEIKFTP